MIEFSVPQFAFFVWALGALVAGLMTGISWSSPDGHMRRDFENPDERRVSIVVTTCIVALWFITIPWMIYMLNKEGKTS